MAASYNRRETKSAQFPDFGKVMFSPKRLDKLLKQSTELCICKFSISCFKNSKKPV